MDSSVIVVTSDHGDMDTHHRLVFKGPAPFEQLQRVPLAAHVPEAFGGQTGVDSESLLSNVDLYPTLLDFAEADAGNHDGISLRPVLTGQAEHHSRTEAVIEYPEPFIQTVRRGDTKLSVFEDGGEMLYDLAQDPEELRNLASVPEHSGIRDALRDALPALAPADQGD
jgi:choline-sulfatase